MIQGDQHSISQVSPCHAPCRQINKKTGLPFSRVTRRPPGTRGVPSPPRDRFGNFSDSLWLYFEAGGLPTNRCQGMQKDGSENAKNIKMTQKGVGTEVIPRRGWKFCTLTWLVWIEYASPPSTATPWTSGRRPCWRILLRWGIPSGLFPRDDSGSLI